MREQGGERDGLWDKWRRKRGEILSVCPWQKNLRTKKLDFFFLSQKLLEHYLKKKKFIGFLLTIRGNMLMPFAFKAVLKEEQQNALNLHFNLYFIRFFICIFPFHLFTTMCDYDVHKNNSFLLIYLN